MNLRHAKPRVKNIQSNPYILPENKNVQNNVGIGKSTNQSYSSTFFLTQVSLQLTRLLIYF